MNDTYIGKLFVMGWHPPNPKIVDNTKGNFLFMVLSKSDNKYYPKEGYLCESLTSGRQYIYNEYEIISGLVAYKQWKEHNNV